MEDCDLINGIEEGSNVLPLEEICRCLHHIRRVAAKNTYLFCFLIIAVLLPLVA